MGRRPFELRGYVNENVSFGQQHASRSGAIRLIGCERSTVDGCCCSSLLDNGDAVLTMLIIEVLHQYVEDPVIQKRIKATPEVKTILVALFNHTADPLVIMILDKQHPDAIEWCDRLNSDDKPPYIIHCFAAIPRGD